MSAGYEFAKELLVDAGFNDGRPFTIKKAREVVGPEFERRGYTRPYEKVAKELQFLALTEEDERRAYGHRRGGRVLTRVKKGVYTFTNPTPAPDDPAPAPAPAHKHRPGRPGSYHMMTNIRKVIRNHTDNPQPNPTDWVLQEEWTDV